MRFVIALLSLLLCAAYGYTTSGTETLSIAEIDTLLSMTGPFHLSYTVEVEDGLFFFVTFYNQFQPERQLTFC
jgi:hypothetical protein